MPNSETGVDSPGRIPPVYEPYWWFLGRTNSSDNTDQQWNGCVWEEASPLYMSHPGYKPEINVRKQELSANSETGIVEAIARPRAQERALTTLNLTPALTSRN